MSASKRPPPNPYSDFVRAFTTPNILEFQDRPITGPNNLLLRDRHVVLYIGNTVASRNIPCRPRVAARHQFGLVLLRPQCSPSPYYCSGPHAGPDSGSCTNGLPTATRLRTRRASSHENRLHFSSTTRATPAQQHCPDKEQRKVRPSIACTCPRRQTRCEGSFRPAPASPASNSTRSRPHNQMPQFVDPVNATLSTSMCRAISRADVGPVNQATVFTTPSGNPALQHAIRPKRSDVREYVPPLQKKCSPPPAPAPIPSLQSATEIPRII